MQPKFMVVSLSKIIKIGAAALIGAGLIMGAVHIFSSDNKSAYVPGTYTSGIILQGKAVDVEVTVSKNKIENVALSNFSESQQVFYPAFNSCITQVSEAVVEYQSTDFPRSSEYPVSEDIILQAVENALNQARE